jgi:hypothetical protein
MTFTVRHATLLVLLANALPALADSYTIRGAGSCKEWTASANDRGWVLGYISGFNAARTSDLTQGMKNDEVIERITQICKADPAQDFDDAMQTLIADLAKPPSSPAAQAPRAPQTPPRVASPSASATAERSITLTDLKLDIARMEGQRVAVRAKISTAGGMSMLTDPALPFDGNPVMADTESLPREDREFILTRCNLGCTVTVRGVVSPVLFQPGLKLLGVQR